MVIDDEKLVQGLIGNLAELSSLASEPRAQALVKSSQTIALELYRRTDAPKWVERYAEGRRLIARAVACACAATPSHDTLTTLLAELPEVLPPHLNARSRDGFFETIRRGIQVSSDGSGYPRPTGTRFFISRRVAGTNLGTAVQAHAPISAAATRALGEALARIHTLPLDLTDEQLRQSHLRPPTEGMLLQEVIRRRVDDWRRYFRSLQAPTFPVLELAFQWLLENVSASDGDVAVLVHGDYGLHNILIHDDRVSAVLDWEACHVGDRALDLSHILAGTAGKMERELFMSAYIAAGGRRVSEFRLKYYQVLMSMQFMLSTIDAQHIFQRRAAGTQYCTLRLGFIEYTANSVVNGIREASAARELEASFAGELQARTTKTFE